MSLPIQQQFGTLLKKFRKRKSKYPILGQKELARALYMSAETIGTWERNRNLPGSRKKILQLATLLHLTDVETDQLLLAANFPPLFEDEKRDSKQAKWSTGPQKRAIDVPSVPTPVWNVPYQRNPYFTGRETVLEHLHEILSSKQAAAIVQRQAITGLGGIGKTQVAIEYTYRFYDDYKAVLWVRADTRETLLSDFVILANRLDLPEKGEQDQNRIVEAVKHWFQQHAGWLLILDNANDLTTTQEFLPTLGRGHILLTTRAHSVGQLAPHPIELDILEEKEGEVLLLRRAGILSFRKALDTVAEIDRTIASMLVQEMGGLPLALDQAGAYVEETECKLSHYLDLYQTRHADLLKWQNSLPSAYLYNVATTWSLSFQQVEERNLIAAEMLRLCAFLHPDAIHEDIFTEVGDDLGPVLKAIADDPFLLDEAIDALLRYSLVKRNAETRTLTIHRLVQTVLKDTMDEKSQRLYAERTVRLINHMFPTAEIEPIDTNLWLKCEMYLSHAHLCLVLIDQHAFTFSEAAQLLDHTGCYLYIRGLYIEATPFLELALKIREKALGMEHPDTATSFNNVAILYRIKGHHAEAEPLYQRALAIREKVLGTEHPDTATTLITLAGLYRDQGRYAEAEALFQRALAIREKVFGLEHPHVAYSLNALAVLYRNQSRYLEAETLYQRALGIYQKAFGMEHPDTARNLNNLALLYRDQGRYTEAESLLQRALAIREKVLGKEHPDTANSLNNLAFLYYAQGRYKETELLFQEALVIREKVLDREHPDIATSLNNLAFLYRTQGRYAEAEPLLQRALAIREKIFGREHPDTANSLINLALLYFNQSRYAEAEPLFQRTLAIYEKTLGREHSDTASSLNHLGNLYRVQGRYTEAEPLLQHALAIREKVLGKEHPHTASSFNSLALLYRDQERYAEAEALFQHALAIQVKFLGAEHPETIATKEQYAALQKQKH